MPHLRSFLLLLMLSVLSQLSIAQQFLVSTEWLDAHRNHSQLTILHVGSEKDYHEGHIPGAVLITLDMIGVEDAQGLRLQLPPVIDLEKTLGALGIGNASHTVIYAGTSSVQAATRVWFTFDYLGRADKTFLLDGGLALWRKEHRVVTTENVQPKPETLSTQPDAEKVVTLPWVQQHREDANVQLIDARTPNFYSGQETSAATRAGHIPGAVNIPYSSLLDASGKFRPKEELQQLLQVKAGNSPNAQIVTYCHIGQQATVPYFVARMLGLDVKLYDGSFQEWSKQEDLPVSTQ